MSPARHIGTLLADTVRDPRGAIASARALRLSQGTLWGALALCAILRVLAAAALEGAMIPLSLGTRVVLATPMTFAIIVGGSAAITVFVVHYTAKLLRGTGDLTGALLAILLVEGVMVAFDALRVVVRYTVPGLDGIVILAGFVTGLVCLLNLIDVVEGFGNRWKALATLVLGVVGVSFGAALVLMLIGGAAVLQA